MEVAESQQLLPHAFEVRHGRRIELLHVLPCLCEVKWMRDIWFTTNVTLRVAGGGCEGRFEGTLESESGINGF